MKYFFIFLFLAFNFKALPQDSTVVERPLKINGYIKNLESLSFDKSFKSLINNNLIHNRLNLKWKLNKSFIAVMEVRNRILWGDDVKLNPNYEAQLRNKNEAFNLQKSWINNQNLVLHSNIERLYIDLNKTKWNLRLGRQRINWGITTIWNPNDIFNNYNFLDFDYEERPGIDGAKLQYLFTDFSNVEIAYAQANKKGFNIAALKYNLNIYNYDFQLITAIYNNNLALGAGWAGNIENAGFKGEIQYFTKDKTNKNHLNMAFESDYMFSKGWYANFGFLYNSTGITQPIISNNSFNFTISPENLMPTKWNIVATNAKTLTPLLSANVSLLYAPGTNLAILLPSIKYNLASNLEVDIIWQSFFAELNNNFEAINHRAFLRTKWNF